MASSAKLQAASFTPPLPHVQHQPQTSSLIVRVAQVAVKCIITATLIGPFLVGIYEAWRAKTVQNLYSMDKPIFSFETLRRGMKELWGHYTTASLEKMEPQAVQAVRLPQLSDYQLSSLASRKEVVQAMNDHQINILIERLNPTVVVPFLSEDQITSQIKGMESDGFGRGAFELLAKVSPAVVKEVAIFNMPTELLRALLRKEVVSEMTEAQIGYLSEQIDIDQLTQYLDPSQRQILIKSWITFGFSTRPPSEKSLQWYYLGCTDVAQQKAFLAKITSHTLTEFFRVAYHEIDLAQPLHQLSNRAVSELFSRNSQVNRRWVLETLSPDQLHFLVEHHYPVVAGHLPAILPKCCEKTFNLLVPKIGTVPQADKLAIFKVFSSKQVNLYLAAVTDSKDIALLLSCLTPEQIAALTPGSIRKILAGMSYAIGFDHGSLPTQLRNYGMNTQAIIDQFKEKLSSSRSQIAAFPVDSVMNALSNLGLSNYLFLLLSPEQIKAIDLGTVKLKVGKLRELFQKLNIDETPQDAQPWLLSFPHSVYDNLKNHKIDLRQLFVAQLQLLTYEQKLQLIQLSDFTMPPLDQINRLLLDVLTTNEIEDLPHSTFRPRLPIEIEWDELFCKRTRPDAVAPARFTAPYRKATESLRLRIQNDYQTPYGFLGFTKLPTEAELTTLCTALLAEIDPKDVKNRPQAQEAAIFAPLVEKAQAATLAIIQALSTEA